MKIYRVVGHDSGFAWYHFATKREADKFAAQLRRDYKDGDFAMAEVEVESVEVKPTRQGICDALDSFITQTCINEH